MSGVCPGRTAAQTDQLIEYLEAGRWDEVLNLFDGTLAASLDREQLARVWTQIRVDAGPLVRHGPACVGEKDGVAVATSRLEFEKRELNLCAVFNSDLTIAGLTIRPLEATE